MLVNRLDFIKAKGENLTTTRDIILDFAGGLCIVCSKGCYYLNFARLVRKLNGIWEAQYKKSITTQRYSTFMTFAPNEEFLYQGQYTGLTSIEIPSASIVDFDDRDLTFTNVGAVQNGKLFYKDQEIPQTQRTMHFDNSDTLRARLKIEANYGYTTVRPQITLNVITKNLGLTFEKTLPIPYTYNEATREITIPACCIFETSATTPSRPSMSFKTVLRETFETNYFVYLGEKQIPIKDGFIIKDELNETLDSGTIQFLVEGGQSDIEPFDPIAFDFCSSIPNFARKKQLVDTYIGEIEQFNTTLENSDYLYTVNTFSETKLFERCLCPNLSITKTSNYLNADVWHKVIEVCRRYLPYIRVWDDYSAETKLVPMYRIDADLRELLAVECPEFVWNTPTLKEVLTDLFSVANLIPVIKDNVLTYFDLNKKGNAIDTSKLNNMQVSGTSADYCDSLTLPMKNVLSKQPVVKKEIIHITSNSGVITTENMIFKTQHPIYNIKKATLYIRNEEESTGSFIDTQTILDKIDITDIVKEKKEFDALPFTAVVNGRETQNYYKQFKQFNLYYTRGSNEINGLGDEHSFKFDAGVIDDFFTVGLLGFLTTNEHIIHYWRELAGYSAYLLYKNYTKRILDTFAEIEYETIEETTINVSKDTPIKNKQNSLFDSQNANSVDLEHQSIYEYAKVNRLANKILTIYGVYEDENEVPQLSDYIGEKILFSRELNYFDNFIAFKGQLVDNYILRDYFTGVVSKRRSWNIADTNEAIIREDIYKMYVVLSKDDNAWTDDEKLHYFEMSIKPEAFSFTINDYEATDKNRYSNIHFLSDAMVEELELQNDAYAIVESNIFEAGKSLIFSFKFNDNYSVGEQKDYNEDLPINVMVNYASKENGECNEIEVVLQDTINQTGYARTDIPFNQYLEDCLNATTYTNAKFTSLSTAIDTRPLLYLDEQGDYRMKYKAKFVKDNREIIASSLQFEYVSNDPNIIIKDNIVKYISAGSGELNENWGIAIARNHKYKQNDIEAVGEMHDTWKTYANDNCFGIKTSDTTIGENDAWCIYDLDTNKIVLAVNGYQTIYANFCYIRDENVYNNEIDRVKIGTIYNNAEQLSSAYGENPPHITEIKVLDKTINVDLTLEIKYPEE